MLTWSGPDGWRHCRPRLVPKPTLVMSDPDAGFTMIELLVALLVMGILLAIAVPTFLGTTAGAYDRSAQTNLTTAFTDAKTQFEGAGQTYDVGGSANAGALASVLGASRRSLTFTTGSSDSESDISVSVSSDGVGIVLAAFSVPGNCFYIVDNTGPLSSAATSSTPYLATQDVTTL